VVADGVGLGKILGFFGSGSSGNLGCDITFSRLKVRRQLPSGLTRFCWCSLQQAENPAQLP
jgi:hypothetical protein